MIPYEGVIRCDTLGLDGRTFKLETVLNHRRGISGYLVMLYEHLGYALPVLHISATDETETGPDGIPRLVYRKPARYRKSRRKHRA